MANHRANQNGTGNYNGEDYDPNHSSQQPLSNNYDNDETQVFSPVRGNDDPGSLLSGPYREEEDFSTQDEDVTISGISRKVDRLKREYPNYDREIFDIADGLIQATISLSAEYNTIESQNNSLETSLRSKDIQLNEIRKELNAVNAKNAPYSKSAMEERENEFVEKEKKAAIIRNVLIGVSCSMLVLALLFVVLWNNEKSRNASSEERSTTQQEQVRTMKSALDEAKKGQADSNTKVSDLQSQVDEIQDQLNKANQKNKDLSNQVKSKDGEINDLNRQVEELNNREPEVVTSTATVTETESQTEQLAPYTTTVTQSSPGTTATVTETETRTNSLF